MKKQIVSDIKAAVALGTPIYKCCDALGIQTRTYYRWTKCTDDKRAGKARVNPKALSEQEKDAIIAVCCSERFVDTNPYEIVAILAEEDTYLASPRTFYRVLKERGLLSHRRSSKPPRKSYRPPELKATGPDQVYSWDITWMPSQVNGLFWYAYVVIDVWSREIVGWTIHDSESEKYARELFLRIKAKRDLKGTWLHADNGNPMRGATFAVTLANMGMFLSHSRPLVKNDNPFIESFFRTLKYHAGYPRRFATIDEARSWTADFINWYNTIHRHSGIGYVTPVQRRTGASSNLFAKRNRTLQEAWKKHPERFPKRGPRMWREHMVVYLNPSRETRKFLYKKVG
ncbi:MAG: IS3 family transposase [Candidatus Thiodiazotropha endolucinida]